MSHPYKALIKRMLAAVPRVPPMLPDELLGLAHSAECPLSMMALPLVWFGTADDDGQPLLGVNPVLVGLQLALESEPPVQQNLAEHTRRTCAALREAVLRNLAQLDVDATNVAEFKPAPASKAEFQRHMKMVERAANRIGVSPRHLLASILGRTLH